MKDRLEIEEIRIRGYRSMEDVQVHLGPLNVIIGPNGVGKSSFLDVLSFLSEALGRREPLGRLLSKRGGIGRLLTLGRRDSIEIGISTRPLDAAGGMSSGPLRYDLEIAAAGIGYSIAKENLAQDRGKPAPFTFVQRNDRSAKVFDHASRKLVRPEPAVPEDELVLASVPRTLREAEWFRTAFADVHYHEAIHVGRDAAVRRPQTLEPTSLVVSPDGQNLFSVLYQLRHEEPEWFERVLDALRAAFPGFDRLEFPVVAGGQVVLAWHHAAFAGRAFFANELSAGTLRFLHLVTLLLSPRAPALLLLDEPEDSLHPELIRLVAELLSEASERAQIIVATQSPSLIRWLKPEQIIVADVQDGGCTLTSGSSLDIGAWLGDYSLDRLWQMGQLGGRP